MADTDSRTTIPAPRSDDPEGILLYGIQRIAEKRRPETGGGYLIMDGIDANEFAGEILMAYLRAKAGVKAA